MLIFILSLNYCICKSFQENPFVYLIYLGNIQNQAFLVTDWYLNACGYYVMKFIKDIVTHDQLEVPEFVSLLLHMTYIVLTYKIVVDLLFKVNCHINMFIMSINSVLWRLSIIKVIYGGGGWSHWRVVQVCFPYCSSYYSKFTSFLEFHTSKEEVGVWHFW